MGIKKKLLLILLSFWVSGCSWMVTSVTEQFANNLSSAILNQNDPETVREAAPAYLIMVDGLIEGNPEQQGLLLTGARLYGAYVVIFVDDAARAQRLTDKAWDYSQRALCLEHPKGCKTFRKPLAEYIEFLNTLDKDDIAVLYSFGASWASWIQTHADSWDARADIPKVQATMQRVVALDDAYNQGEPHMYLSVLSIILPPMLGGKPDQARASFEHANDLAKGRNLMFKVIYAETYGRMLFNQTLHDNLLNEVLEADPEEPGLTLTNHIAQLKAQKLLESSAEYF
ncbi:MAG: hypothetical protein GQ583_11690 [Methyloprofundus sp.]|nr:hypothetical protein [Methyloprofundus sp.]